MKAGFTGGLVVDYPNSTRAKKWVNTVQIILVAWAKWCFLYNLIVILQFPRPTIVTVKSFESCHLEHGPLIIRANTSKVSFLNSWKWPVYIINLVDKTNYRYYHFRGIAPPMQHHSLFRNSIPSSDWFFRIFLCLFAGVVVDKLPKVH